LTGKDTKTWKTFYIFMCKEEIEIDRLTVWSRVRSE